MEYTTGLFLLALILLPFAMVPSMIVITKQKEVKIIERLGKFAGYRSAGFSLKLPWPIDFVVGELNLRVQEISEEIGAKSKDNAFVTIPVKVQFRVIPQKVEQAYYELENPFEQILSYVVNAVRAKANSMDLDGIFASKNDFEETVEHDLKERFESYGYMIENVLVDDPMPSDDLRKAFDKVLAAQRDRDAAELEKEAVRLRTVGIAEAEKESLVLKAEGYVEQRALMAKGNAEAIREFVEGLEGVSHKDVLRYLEKLDMRDAMRDVSHNEASLIMIPASIGEDATQAALTAALIRKMNRS